MEYKHQGSGDHQALRDLLISNEKDPQKIREKWEATGLIDLLNSEEFKTSLALVLEETAQKLLKNDEYEFNDRLPAVLFPCVRRIYLILHGLDLNASLSKKFSSNPKFKEEIIKLFNTDEIIADLNSYSKFFMILGELYLKDIDHEAELTVLFCDNYVWKLRKRTDVILKQKEFLKEKIKQIDEDLKEAENKLIQATDLTNFSKEVQQEIKNLHNQLAEVTLFNSKLMMINKLLIHKNNLSEAQKLDICEKFDEVQTIKEVQELFKQLK